MKRKEQVDKANGVSANSRGGRGGRGGAVTRGGGRTMTKSYQSSMQTVSITSFPSQQIDTLSSLPLPLGPQPICSPYWHAQAKRSITSGYLYIL